MVQTWQIEELSALTELGSAAGEGLDSLLGKIDAYLRRPGKISISGTTITIGATEVTTGPDGKKLSFSPLSGTELGSLTGTVDLSQKDPGVLGPLVSGDVVAEAVTNVGSDEYIYIGFELRDDQAIYMVPGTPSATIGGATLPDFTDGAISLGHVLYQAGTSGVDWGGTIDWVSPADSSNVLQFLSGAGGGGAGAVSATIDQNSHGFSVGDPVRFDNGSDEWVAANGNNPTTFAHGIVTNVLSTDRFTVSAAGIVELSGLTTGETYYLTGSVPSIGYTFKAPYQTLYIALSTTEALLLIEPIEHARLKHLNQYAGAFDYKTGSSLRIRGGLIQLDDGKGLLLGNYESYDGWVIVDLDALEPSPVADTTYYLYVDLADCTETASIETGRDLYTIGSNSFVLTTTDPLAIDKYRYVFLGVCPYGTSDWDEVGAGIASNSFRTWSRQAAAFSPSQIASQQYTTVGQKTFTHGLNGKPTSIEIRYNNGASEQVIDASSYVSDVDETSIVLELGSFPFAGGDYVEVIAEYQNSLANHFVTPQTQFTSSWLTSSGTLSVAHNLSSAEAIKSAVVVEWDVTAGEYRQLELSSIVDYWDDTNIYLDWTGYTPSATLQYQIITGGSPLPSAIPSYLSGFTKYVGFGPGYYSSLSSALTDAVAGDQILVTQNQDLGGSPLTISVSNIVITFMRNASINNALNLTGSDITLENVRFTQGSETWAYGVNISGDMNCLKGKMFLADGTITNLVTIQSGADVNQVDLRVSKGTATVGTTTDAGTDNDVAVWGV